MNSGFWVALALIVAGLALIGLAIRPRRQARKARVKRDDRDAGSTSDATSGDVPSTSHRHDRADGNGDGDGISDAGDGGGGGD